MTVSNRGCAHWDSSRHTWSRRGCRTLGANATHTRCACAHFGMLALVGEASLDDGSKGGSVAAVAVAVAAAVAVLCVAVAASVALRRFRRGSNPVSCSFCRL